jgi:hypothetical protein
MATAPTSKAPYKIFKRGGKYVVVNNGNEVKAAFADRDKAIAYLRALYANVPNAAKRAAKNKWTGKQKRQAAGTGPWTTRQLWHAAVAGGWERADGPATEAPAPQDVLDNEIFALLDATFTLLEDMGVEVLSLELQHAMELLRSGPVTDQVLALLGVDQEDEMPQTAAEPAKPYGDVTYADPGYQRDKKKRYPIDSAAHVRSAWSYISQSSNASKYSAQQRETIKARIRTAAKKFKVELSESAMTIGETLDANAQLYFDQLLAKGAQAAAIEELRGLGADTVEEAVVTPAHKSKKGKHRFVAHTKVDSTNYRGAGWGGLCIACSKPGNDPDHDGDIDNPADPTDNDAPTKVPVSAAEQSAAGLSIPNGNQLIWNGVPYTTPTTPLFPMYTYTLGSNAQSTISGFVQVNDRPTAPLVEGVAAPKAEAVKAFLTEVNGKTLLTGPASTFTPSWEKALSPNEHMLWLQGRFVGAEKANRNGAFWSTADLELGEATVKYGPLNWLHDAKHIIGTIADTRLRVHEEASDQPLEQPYIEAASVIWSWIYRDEASVVEMASDSGRLWYSMECISKNVECVGEGGCGTTVPYMEYVTGEKACEHMKERSATRRFADPTFLGGAVIMPPARPGWAEADAQVMRVAASLAEKAYDQAGQPDIPASEWEQVMAGIVRFAE